jgi:predicted nuclease of predicted toxin-antitoxin system
MPEFLVDSNLPYFISLFNTEPFVSALELGIHESDSLIWKHAKEHSLTILTQDADFRQRLQQSGPPPKVVHFKTGNCTPRQFRVILERHWPTVVALLARHSLVTVFPDVVLGA